jgi:hypothetical protein
VVGSDGSTSSGSHFASVMRCHDSPPDAEVPKLHTEDEKITRLLLWKSSAERGLLFLKEVIQFPVQAQLVTAIEGLDFCL